MRVDIIPDDGYYPIHGRSAEHGFRWWDRSCFLLKSGSGYDGIENWDTTAEIKGADPTPYPSTFGSMWPTSLSYTHRIPVVHLYYMSGPDGSTVTTAHVKHAIRNLTGKSVTLFVNNEEGILQSRGYVSSAPTIAAISVDGLSFEATITIICPDPIRYTEYEDYEYGNSAQLNWVGAGDVVTYPIVEVHGRLSVLSIRANEKEFRWRGTQATEGIVVDGLNNIPTDLNGTYLEGITHTQPLELNPHSSNSIEVATDADSNAKTIIRVRSGWK